MPESVDTDDTVLWSYHEDRQAAIDEVHARPALEIIAPATVLHIAFTCDQEEIEQLFSTIAGEEKSTNRRHAITRIGNIDVKIERHTEFTTCTFVANNTEDQAELVTTYREIFRPQSVRVLSKCKVALVTSIKDLAKQNSFGKRIYGGTMRGDMLVQSTLEVDDENSITYAVMAKDKGPYELGRRIQRLFEVETYRIVALIGLPVARRMSGKLTELENELNTLISKLETDAQSDELPDKELFSQLSSLSGRVDNLRSESRFRFSASNAYFDIVDARMISLEETEHSDLQTISGFLRSRLEPARATIQSVERRQNTLTEDISRALTLLRTRIDIDMAEGNQALLKSLDGRYRQQLLISQAVEGLSSIAITYYAVGLLSYFLKAFEKSGQLPLSYTTILAFAVPVILFSVWFAIRRLRIKLHKSDK